MSEIKLYIPKGRARFDPQGRPRVWFAGHPDDINVCLPLLAEEILKISPCAIYYAAESEVPAIGECAVPSTDRPSNGMDHGAAQEPDCGTGDKPSAAPAEHVPDDQLAQMQLFVIPITMKFLRSTCRALTHDYGFAIEQRIPILPIAMESGLAEYFTQRLNKIGPGYGAIQFLDRISADATEIPYQDKLEKRLKSVLTDDKTTSRVRAAFDAYIFLSYRKKDRADAHELMRTIHRIDFCRDIAIWYDEFLVPGEAWSRTIADAMAKSTLVTIAITPSITEPGNYIIEHEYPDAIKSGKPILPALMSEADRERRAQLQRLFPELPEPVDGHSAEEIAQILQQIAIRKNDDSPEHKYLIGLAYLGAIDVERDADRAAALITSAAEAGLIEAMMKLVHMYTNGEGVRCDYHEAIRWQQKLTRLSREAYRRDPDETAQSVLTVNLLLLANQLYKAGQMADAKRAYEEMACLFPDRPDGDDPNPRDLSLYRAVAYRRLGDIERSQGHPDDAMAWYEKSLKLQLALAHRDEHATAQQITAELYDSLGRLELEQGRPDRARAWYEKYLKLYQDSEEQTGTDSRRQHLAAAYNRLGRLEQSQDRPDQAKEWYERAHQLLLEEVGESHSAMARQNLSASYQCLGSVEKMQGHLPEARALFEKSLKLRLELAEEADTTTNRQLLISIYLELGRTELALENRDGARQYYEQSLKLSRELAEETDAEEDYDNYGLSLIGLWRSTRSIRSIRLAVEVYTHLTRIAPDNERYRKALKLAERIYAVSVKKK